MKTILKSLPSLLVLILLNLSCTPKWEIANPYESVDWVNHTQYKANFHTHTTRSDGRLNPHEVVDAYYELGYHILAITDHNGVTYPWTEFSRMKPSQRSIERKLSDPEAMPENFIFENRDPESLKMIAIQANELSRHHHMGSFFNDHNGPEYNETISYSITEEESLKATAEKNGICMIYHPGRYKNSVEWYVDLFDRYDHLIGLEVYNQGDRYPNDRELWDSILSQTMPERPVWGYSNDDMHSSPHIGRNWNVFILPGLSPESVRNGMENGLSYFIYAPDGHKGQIPPTINSIAVNRRKGTIEINASEFEHIHWLSADGVLYEGNILNLKKAEFPGNYVRAVVYGQDNTLAFTQPFGLVRP